MKKLMRQYPFLLRVVLSLVLGVTALLFSGLIYDHLPIRPYFPFVGELLLVGATALLYRTDGQSLKTLGLNPTRKNIGCLFLGLAVGVTAMLAVTWLRTLYTGEAWHRSSAPDIRALAKSLYFILPTVMVQELMFRGYLFTKTIQRYGVVWANVLFSIIFMLVHVLDEEVLRNPAQIVVLAVSIPVGHLWFAAALLRSKTLFFPIGLHWGNNWAVVHLAGTTNSPQTLFYLTDQKTYTTWPSFVILLLIFNAFFLLVTWAIWKGKLPAPNP